MFLKKITALAVMGSLWGVSAASAAEMSPIQRDAIERKACEVAIWALPAVSIYGLELAIQRDAGAKPGMVAFMSKTMDSRHGMLTANDNTPYIFTGFPLNGVPTVIEVPPVGKKAKLFGSILNAWQRPLIDVGPAGYDKGKGAKYIVIPPGYKGDIPKGEGLVPVQSDTNGMNFSFRPTPLNGGSMADASAYSLGVKVYPLSTIDNPKYAELVDVYKHPVKTFPIYDWTYFTDLNTVIQREPVLERDKAMMDSVAQLGMVPGQPFNPDKETKAAMLDGLQCAYDYLQYRFVTDGGSLKKLWKDSEWRVFNINVEQAKKGVPFTNETSLMVDTRASTYFYVTYLPKQLGGGTFYMSGIKDADSNLLNGKDTYKLTVPADTPAEDFWSVIVYSMKTKSFIDGASEIGLSSQDIDNMKVNKDGSVDLYFGPKAPKGLESNWIPTGEDWFALFRMYGPKKGWFQSGWKLPEIEKVK